MVDNDVEFIEEENVMDQRTQYFEENKPEGILGAFIKVTGFSKKRANVAIIVLAVFLFFLATVIFSSTYTDKEVKNNFSDRVRNFDTNNTSR